MYNNYMSLRSRYNKSYNRAEAKEENFYWLDIIFQDDDHHNEWYCCEECSSPWFNMYCGMPGEVLSMDQYHQMKVLTLLRSFRIHAATEEAEERGW